MTDEQKVIAAAITIGALLVLWFALLAVRAIRHRRPHRGSVAKAAETVRALDAGDRPDKLELTEHVAWFTRCDHSSSELESAVGRRGYLALTRSHLVFVPYHRSGPVVMDRARLAEPASRHRKVWKKARGSFSLRFTPEDGSAVTVTFKTREPYTWLYHFGFRSGLADDPFSAS